MTGGASHSESAKSRRPRQCIPTPDVAVTDAHGSYTISGVPPGTYKARIWHEALSGRTVPVKVYDGQVTPLNVALPPNPTWPPE